MPVLSSVRRCARLCLLLLLVCLAGLRPLTAQETRPFISADGVVTFQAPATWSVTDQDAGIISLQDATFTAVLYTPAALAQAGLADQTDPARLALAFVAARQRTPGPLSIFVSGGQPAARQDYTGGEAPAGFVLAVARGDSAPLLLDVTTAGDGRIPQRALEILLTTLEYRPQASPPAPFASYAADGLRFDYPRQWQVAADADRLTLTGPDFTARLLAGPALDVYQVDDPARLVTAYLEAAGYAPGRFDIFLSGRRPAARFEYTAADGTSGLLLGFALADGPLLLLDVLPGPGVNAAILQKDLERVVASLDPAAATATVTTPAAPAATAPVSPARPVAFASSDGTLSLTHPDTWFFGQDDTGRLYGFLGDPAVSLTLYPPELLLAERYPMTIGETPAGFLERYRANFGLALGSIDT
ncbi:MAG: hypothetical protein MUE40_08320, partial [Anaerolineae bacterium]|nr:hypothetical protein [Anaerolineae bacterium]